MRIRLLVGAVIVLTACTGRIEAQTDTIQEQVEKTLQTMRAMQGTWKAVAIERNGVKAPNDETLKKFRVVISSDTLTADDGTKQIPATFRVDVKPKVTTLEMRPSEGEARGKYLEGIFELDGDSLKICFDHEGRNGKRPTAFKTKPNSGQTLYILKREKK